MKGNRIEQGNEVGDLEQKLQTLRESNGDIYLIGRTLMMLKARGVEAEPNGDEWNEMTKSLERARSGKSMPPLVPGYEVARWLMILRSLKPNEIGEVSKDDKDLIGKGFEDYLKEENYYQIASLAHTCSLIACEDISHDFLKLLSREQRKEVEQLLPEFQ